MRKGRPLWTWGATVVLFLIVVWLSSPRIYAYDAAAAEAPVPAAGARFAQADGFGEVADIVRGRCSMCHAAEPAWAGMHWPPKGVMLETDAQIAVEATRIYLQAGVTHAMPPGNRSGITDDERGRIVAWFRAAG